MGSIVGRTLRDVENAPPPKKNKNKIKLLLRQQG